MDFKFLGDIDDARMKKAWEARGMTGCSEA